MPCRARPRAKDRVLCTILQATSALHDHQPFLPLLFCHDIMPNAEGNHTCSSRRLYNDVQLFKQLPTLMLSIRDIRAQQLLATPTSRTPPVPGTHEREPAEAAREGRAAHCQVPRHLANPPLSVAVIAASYPQHADADQLWYVRAGAEPEQRTRGGYVHCGVLRRPRRASQAPIILKSY